MKKKTSSLLVMTTDHTVPAKKSLGQHFLTSDIVPGWMCDAADLQPEELVVEIGPGTGVLTKELLQRGAVVHAIETDNRSIVVLQQRFADEISTGRLHLYAADIKHGYPKELQPVLTKTPFKVIANIPYYLSGFILRLILENTIQPTTVSVLMQKEVVERIARDPELSLAALGVRVFGTPKFFKKVSAGHFTPRPRVESAILKITTIGFHAVSKEDIDHFFLVAKTGFAHKRKFLLKNLKNVWTETEIHTAFMHAGVASNIRAENLSIEQWVTVAKSLPKTTPNLYT